MAKSTAFGKPPAQPCPVVIRTDTPVTACLGVAAVVIAEQAIFGVCLRWIKEEAIDVNHRIWRVQRILFRVTITLRVLRRYERVLVPQEKRSIYYICNVYYISHVNIFTASATEVAVPKMWVGTTIVWP
jgi:hypothetical protein